VIDISTIEHAVLVVIKYMSHLTIYGQLISLEISGTAIFFFSNQLLT
jgi:hypothetical protein